MKKPSENFFIGISITTILLACLIYIGTLANKMYKTISSDPSFGATECSVHIQVIGVEETDGNIIVVYSGKEFKRICESAFDKQSEFFKPFDPQVLVFMEYFRYDNYEQYCSRMINEGKTGVTVRSNSEKMGKSFCKGLMAQ